MLKSIPSLRSIARFALLHFSPPLPPTLVSDWPRIWRALRLLVFWGLLLNLYQLSRRTFVASIPRNPVHCLHPFTIWAVQRVTEHLDGPGFFSLPTQLVLVLLLCYSCSAMILHFFLKRDIFR